MRRFRTYHEVDPEAGAELPEQVDAQMRRLTQRLDRAGAIWLVASGKGGVGKSAVTANLAAALAKKGLRTGALDADLNGPSLARMLGANRASLTVRDDGVEPAIGAGGTRVMSMDLLLESPDAPVRWREPDTFGFVWQSALETGTLREFLADVAWGELDVLLLDLPPGTDKLMRTFQLVPDPAGVLLVTTPSDAARSVVGRSLRLVRELGKGHLGLVANMAGVRCERCGHAQHLFEANGARRLADESGVEIWAEIPFEAAFARETDAGRPPVLAHTDLAVPDGPAAALHGLADRVASASPVSALALGETPRDTPGGRPDNQP